METIVGVAFLPPLMRLSRLARFRRQGHTRGRGAVAESQAIAWLEGQGYRIVERNHTTKAGEIDVIAEEDDTLCFVEIKARLNDTYGPAIAAVRPEKQRRLSRAAKIYLSRTEQWNRVCRFDVLGMDAAPEGWRFTLVRNAFEVRE